MEFIPIQTYGPAIHVGFFWKRLGALIIDGFVFLLMGELFTMLISQISDFVLWHEIVLPTIGDLSYVFYYIFFHYRFGATLGKMALGIKVTQPNGSKINFKQAFLRSIVDFSSYIVLIILSFYILPQIDVSYYQSLTEDNKFTYLFSSFPLLFYIVAMYIIWLLGDLIYLLFHKRKRALHDIIAGTVVIKKEFAKQR